MSSRGRLVRGAGTLMLLMCASTWPLAAQEPASTAPDPHAAQPERPTVATHAGTVARGWLEIEAGTELDEYASHADGGAAPLLVKIGIAPRMQLSLWAPVSRPPDLRVTGLGDLSVGVKWRLVDDAPVVGDFAVLPSVTLPTGDAHAGLGSSTTALGVLLISSHALGPVSMDINAGFTHRSGNGALAPRSATLWTVSFGGPASGALGWTAEMYGYPGTSGASGAAPIVALLAGPTLEAREWLVFDTGIIEPLTGPQPRAVYAGAVYNVGRLWR